MDLVKVIIFAVGRILLGVIGGFAARSIFAGIVLAVFVFVGWFLWRLFKLQDVKETEPEPVEAE
jgi:hypothetical protein